MLLAVKIKLSFRKEMGFFIVGCLVALFLPSERILRFFLPTKMFC